MPARADAIPQASIKYFFTSSINEFMLLVFLATERGVYKRDGSALGNPASLRIDADVSDGVVCSARGGITQTVISVMVQTAQTCVTATKWKILISTLR